MPPTDTDRHDPGPGLAAPKIVSLDGILDGRRVRIARLGPSFDPPSSGEAHTAGSGLEGAIEKARADGHALALALTPASGEMDALRGFRPLPASEAACRTVLPAPWPKEPEWLKAGEDPLRRVPGLRAARPGDLDALASLHAEAIAGQRLRIDRDGLGWERLLATGAEAPRWVIDRKGRVDAYVLLGAGRTTLRWREHGARRGAEELLIDLFWSVLAWARGAGLARIEGWCMPEVLTVRPLYPTSDRSRKGRVPMLRALDPGVALPDFRREQDCRLWEPDLS